MLEITIPKRELYDEVGQEFIEQPEVTLVLEHSLVSISKWESKWEIPFLDEKPLTDAQVLDYIKLMNLSGETSDEVFDRLTQDNFDAINNYIKASMTATWFSENNKKSNRREVITTEIIYYWMVSLQIPFECQHWHVNRLLTLIKVCNEKNNPPDKKKMSKSELAARNRSLNEQRRAQMKTNG